MHENILEFIKAQDYESAVKLAGELPKEELATLLSSLDEADIPAFCRALDSELLADTLLLLEPTLKEQVINGLRDDELDKVFDEMSVDD